MIDLEPDQLGAALLFAAEPTDRALAGWGPASQNDGHPRSWARWMLRAYAGLMKGEWHEGQQFV